MQQITYRYQVGDILRLRRSSPLATAGDYVLRSVDDTVCLSRLVRTARGRKLSRKPLYMLITDLCLLDETGRRYHDCNKHDCNKIEGSLVSGDTLPPKEDRSLTLAFAN
jgi:hypothetical protein